MIDCMALQKRMHRRLRLHSATRLGGAGLKLRRPLSAAAGGMFTLGPRGFLPGFVFFCHVCHLLTVFPVPDSSPPRRNGFPHFAAAALSFQCTAPTGWYRRGAGRAPFSMGAAGISGAPSLITWVLRNNPLGCCSGFEL
jgi:hypothetical protein